jgi:chromosome segregation and condensation protein ScpB|tara:strand:- start:430 stop:600 length:171 start_codon:yes stop_codon:yes gene_type:complete
MIKTFLKTELVINLWEGLNNGYITTDEYAEMLELQSLSDYSDLDKEMALDSENIEF